MVYVCKILIVGILATFVQSTMLGPYSVDTQTKTDDINPPEDNPIPYFPKSVSWHLTDEPDIESIERQLTESVRKPNKHHQERFRSKLLKILHNSIFHQKGPFPDARNVSNLDILDAQTFRTMGPYPTTSQTLGALGQHPTPQTLRTMGSHPTTSQTLRAKGSRPTTSQPKLFKPKTLNVYNISMETVKQRAPIIGLLTIDGQSSVNDTLQTANQDMNEWRFLLLDPRLWIGTIIGSVFSITSIMVGFVLYYVILKNRRRNYCVDLNNLSLCSLGNQKNKDPVYVRLSQLHNPRKDRKDSQYIISMNQSNNFSICTDSESSSSEEEIFNASDTRQSAKHSTSKISMTSTPVKANHCPQEYGGQRPQNIPYSGSPFASPIVNRDHKYED